MMEFHALLRRQWDRFFGRQKEPDEWVPFLGAVNTAYHEFDTARRLLERALALSSEELRGANDELRGVLQVLPDLIFRVQADDRVSGVMQGSAVNGHPELKSLTDPASPGAARFRRGIQEVRMTRSPATFEYAHGSEPSPIQYEVRLLPFVGSDIIGIARNVTDRKQAEHDRLILGKLESTGILAGGIAHDYNNLLTSILLNIDLASTPGATREAVEGHLAMMRSGVHAARGLTQQLLTFARAGAGLRQPVVLTETLRESVSVVLSGAAVSGELSIADDLWPAEVDAGQIAQVVRNLVLNAREAMATGGVVSVRAGNVLLSAEEVTSLPPGPYVRIDVTDRGQGIAPGVLRRIFDPYFSTKMRGAQKGMGLGLTICHSIVQQHGGAITVETATGVGTTFTVHLPAVRDADVRDREGAYAQATAAARARVLVMDDEPMVRAVFKSIMRQLEYDAELVADGRAALEAYERARAAGLPFDVVILDLTIKGDMGGVDTIRELRTRNPDVRAIVMSGYTEDDAMQRYRQLGFRARLSKPFDRATLQEVLRKVLATSD